MENFGKTAIFPGRYGWIGGNTAWADMAGLGSIGLISKINSTTQIDKQTNKWGWAAIATAQDRNKKKIVIVTMLNVTRVEHIVCVSPVVASD